MREVRERYGVRVWKTIRNEWEGIRSRSHFLVGNERRIKFWKDLWYGHQALEEAFPSLFSCVVNKDEWVVEAWE